MAARRRRSPRRPARPPAGRAASRAWTVGLLLAAGAAGGILYNAVAPKGIFAPAAAPAKPGPSTAPTARPKPAPGPSTAPAARPKPAPAAPARVSVPASERIPREPQESQESQEPREAREPVEIRVTLEEVRRLYESGEGLFVDARSPQRFALGHVPGARNLPATDFDAAFARLRSALTAAKVLVVYCTSADCDESDLVVAGLAGKGFRGIRHFKGGWMEWENAGLPQERGPDRP